MIAVREKVKTKDYVRKKNRKKLENRLRNGIPSNIRKLATDTKRKNQITPNGKKKERHITNTNTYTKIKTNEQ